MQNDPVASSNPVRVTEGDIPLVMGESNSYAPLVYEPTQRLPAVSKASCAGRPTVTERVGASLAVNGAAYSFTRLAP